eukprot:Gb_10061 [translate_table: standard]
MVSWVCLQQIYDIVVGDPAKGALEINWRDFVPYIGPWLPNRPLHNKLRQLTKRRAAVVRALIEEERKLLSSGKVISISTACLESPLLTGHAAERRERATWKQLETAIWEPLVESIITSHVTMVWAMFELGRNKKCQKRLRKEIKRACGDGVVREDDVHKLPYLIAIIPVHEDVELDGRQEIMRGVDASGVHYILTIARIAHDFEWQVVLEGEDKVETVKKTGTHRLHPLIARHPYTHFSCFQLLIYISHHCMGSLSFYRWRSIWLYLSVGEVCNECKPLPFPTPEVNRRNLNSRREAEDHHMLSVCIVGRCMERMARFSVEEFREKGAPLLACFANGLHNSRSAFPFKAEGRSAQTIGARLSVEEFRQKGAPSWVPEEVLARCESVPEYFVSHPQSCNGISNLSGFETAVDTSAMKRNCNGSQIGRGFNCQKCVRAMADARHQLHLLCVDCTKFRSCKNWSQQNSSGYCDSSYLGNPVAIGHPVKWKRLYFVQGSRRITLLQRYQLLKESVDVNHGLVFFSLSEIRTSTGNFMASNVIGEGGFSTVYRGTLSDGSPIAVKRFKDYTAKGDINFTHEVQVISSVRHRNLMPLKGYCIERNEEGSHEQLLVYDFMPNGSLADYLFKKDKPCLSWNERHKIAVGIAQGLFYLHEDAKPAIIHGMFKLEESKTHYTTRAVGTPGYVAPEYALYGHLTDKNDVFSFGILLLELMSGQKALNSHNVEHLLISDWACNMLQRDMSDMAIYLQSTNNLGNHRLSATRRHLGIACRIGRID